MCKSTWNEYSNCENFCRYPSCQSNCCLLQLHGASKMLPQRIWLILKKNYMELPHKILHRNYSGKYRFCFNILKLTKLYLRVPWQPDSVNYGRVVGLVWIGSLWNAKTAKYFSLHDSCLRILLSFVKLVVLQAAALHSVLVIETRRIIGLNFFSLVILY